MTSASSQKREFGGCAYAAPNRLGGNILQAVVQRNAAVGKSHADWLAELAKEVDLNNRNSLDVNQCGGALVG